MSGERGADSTPGSVARVLAGFGRNGVVGTRSRQVPLER